MSLISNLVVVLNGLFSYSTIKSFRLSLELPSAVYITTEVSYRFTRRLLSHTHIVPSLSLLQVLY